LRRLIADMKVDGRYRTFIQLERIAGEFPTGTVQTDGAAS
jgi:5-aminolevulinate synthase